MYKKTTKLTCFVCNKEPCMVVLTERGRCSNCGLDIEDMLIIANLGVKLSKYIIMGNLLKSFETAFLIIEKIENIRKNVQEE